jgi:hypothetical protein
MIGRRAGIYSLTGSTGAVVAIESHLYCCCPMSALRLYAHLPEWPYCDAERKTNIPMLPAINIGAMHTGR